MSDEEGEWSLLDKIVVGGVFVGGPAVTAGYAAYLQPWLAFLLIIGISSLGLSVDLFFGGRPHRWLLGLDRGAESKVSSKLGVEELDYKRLPPRGSASLDNPGIVKIDKERIDYEYIDYSFADSIPGVVSMRKDRNIKGEVYKVYLYDEPAIPAYYTLEEALKDIDLNEGGAVIPYGKDYADEYQKDLDKLPHLMIAGGTGSGKTAYANSAIIALLEQGWNLRVLDPKGDIATDYFEDHYTHRIEAFEKNKYNGHDFLGEVKDLVNKRNNMSNEKQQKLQPVLVAMDELLDFMGNEESKDLIKEIARKARSAKVRLIGMTQDPRASRIGDIRKNFEHWALGRGLTANLISQIFQGYSRSDIKEKVKEIRTIEDYAKNEEFEERGIFFVEAGGRLRIVRMPYPEQVYND